MFSLLRYIVVFMRFHTLRELSSHLVNTITNVLLQLLRKFFSFSPLYLYFIVNASCNVYWFPVNHDARRSDTFPNDRPEAASCLFHSSNVVGNETIFTVFFPYQLLLLSVVCSLPFFYGDPTRSTFFDSFYGDRAKVVHSSSSKVIYIYIYMTSLRRTRGKYTGQQNMTYVFME